MFPLQIKVTKYIKDFNACEAVLASGEVVAFDPFVSGEIELSCSDYESGKGAELIGKTFLLSNFSVSPSFIKAYSYEVVPHEGGMIEVSA